MARNYTYTISLDGDTSGIQSKLQDLWKQIGNTNATIGLTIEGKDVTKQFNDTWNKIKKSLDSKTIDLSDLTEFGELISKLDETDNTIKTVKGSMGLLLDITKEIGKIQLGDSFAPLVERLEAVIDKLDVLNKKESGFSADQFEAISSILTNIEDHLSTIRKALSEVGDGKEVSPLMNYLNDINDSLKIMKETIGSLDDGKIRNVATNLQLINKKVGKSQFNISIQEDNSSEAQQRQEKANQFLEKQYNTWLKRYEALQEAIRSSRIQDPFSIIASDDTIGREFDFDLEKIRDLYGTTAIAGLDNVKDRILRIIEAIQLFKKTYNNALGNGNTQISSILGSIFSSKLIPKDISADYINSRLREIYDIKGSSTSSEEKANSLLDQIQNHNDSINKIEDQNKIGDLKQILDYLSNINNSLTTILDSLKQIASSFSNGLNISTSVDEIINLTEKVKQLEEELVKLKTQIPQNAVTNPDKKSTSSEHTPIKTSPIIKNAVIKNSRSVNGTDSIVPVIQEQQELQAELEETDADYEKASEARKKFLQETINKIPQEEGTARYVHWGNIDQSKAILSNPDGMSTGDYGMVSSFADCLGEAQTAMTAIVDSWDYLHAQGFDRGSALIFDIPLEQARDFEKGLKDNIPQEYLKGYIDTENGAITLNNTLRDGLKETELQADKTATAVSKVLVYRGTNGDSPISNNPGMYGTFWTTSKKAASQHGANNNSKALFSSEISMNNPLTVDANGAAVGSILYLGDALDEASIKITELSQRERELQSITMDETKTEEEHIQAGLELVQVLQDIKKISNNPSNPYGYHSADWFGKYASENGYDGVHIKNVLYSSSNSDKPEITDFYITQQEEQLENTTLLARADKELAESERMVWDAQKGLQSVNITPRLTDAAARMSDLSTSAEQAAESIEHVNTVANSTSTSGDKFMDFDDFEELENASIGSNISIDPKQVISSLEENLGSLEKPIKAEISELLSNVSDQTYESLTKSILKVLTQSNQFISAPGYEDENADLKSFVRGKIKYSPDYKTEFGDDWLKANATLGFTSKDGIDIMTILGECNEVLGTNFDLTMSNQDAIRALYEVLSQKPDIGISELPSEVSEIVTSSLKAASSMEEVISAAEAESSVNKEAAVSAEQATVAIQEETTALASLENAEHSQSADKVISDANEIASAMDHASESTEQAANNLSTFRYKGLVGFPEKLASKLEGRDILSQTVKGDFLKTGKATFLERTQSGEIQQIAAIFNKTTQDWELIPQKMRASFEQVENEILAYDKKIANLKADREAALQVDTSYDSSSDDRLIAISERERKILEDTLRYYSESQGYVYEISIFEERRAAAEEQITEELKKQQNLRASKERIKNQSDIVKTNRYLNKQEISVASIEKTYSKAANGDLDRVVSNKNDLDSLTKQKQEILDLIAKLKDQVRNSSNEKEFLELEKLLAAYKQSAADKLKSNNPNKQQLGQQDLKVSIAQLIGQYDELIAKAKSYGSETDTIVQKLKEQRNLLAQTDSNGNYTSTSDQFTASRDTYKIEKAGLVPYAIEYKESRKVIADLNKALVNYENIQKRIAKGKAFAGDEQEAERLLQTIYDLQRSDILPYQELNKSNEKLIQINTLVEEIKKNIIEGKLKETDSLLVGLDMPEALATDYKNLISKISELNRKLQEGSLEAAEYGKQIRDAISAYKAKSESQPKREDAINDAESRMAKLPKTGNYDELINKVATLSELLYKSEMEISAYNKAIKNLFSEYKEEAQAADSIGNAIAKIHSKIDDLSFSPLLSQQVKDQKTALESLDEQLKKDVISEEEYNEKAKEIVRTLKQWTKLGLSGWGKTQITTLDEAKEAIHKCISEVGTLKGAIKGSATPDSNGIVTWTAQVVTAEGEIQNLSFKWDQATGTIVASASTVGSELTGLSKAWAALKKKSTDLILYWTANFANPYRIINGFRKVINVATELDTALTEMRKVSDESRSSLKEYQKASFGVAKAVGTTAKQIQDSTADWMRLGESLKDAGESARVTNLLMNVSEFDNIEDATNSLVSMAQAYSDLDKLEIVDKLNEVGNNYAISTDELATSLQKSAATLSLMGNTIDEAAAMVTTANNILQDPDSVSAGLRTISLRLVGSSEAENQLEALGEEVDAFVTQTESKKRQIIKDYTAVASNNYKGFDILDENGNYKNTYDILLGIAKVYKEIQEQDKKLGTNNATALVEELAGKNRSNVASAILQDPDQLEAVKKSSEEAAGSAEEELSKYLDSIEGKIQQFTNQWQELAATLGNTTVIKGAISLATDFLSIITQLAKGVGGFSAALGTLSGIGIPSIFKLDYVCIQYANTYKVQINPIAMAKQP